MELYTHELCCCLARDCNHRDEHTVDQTFIYTNFLLLWIWQIYSHGLFSSSTSELTTSAISTMQNAVWTFQFKEDGLQIILVAKTYISTTQSIIRAVQINANFLKSCQLLLYLEICIVQKFLARIKHWVDFIIL